MYTSMCIKAMPVSQPKLKWLWKSDFYYTSIIIQYSFFYTFTHNNSLFIVY